MSAIDNKHLVEILAINVQSGVSKKSGNPYEIHKAQCVVRGPDQSVQIGELNISKELAAKTPPGKYLAEFELGVNFDRLIVPRITALHSWEGATPSPQATQSAAVKSPAKG